MLCLVSAIPTEIESLIEMLGARPAKDRKVWISADPDLVIAAIGVGFLESAINLSQVLAWYPSIDKLIFTGSAGVYPDVASIKPGDLCSCRDTLLADGAAEAGWSVYAAPLARKALPASLPLAVELYAAATATLLTLTKSDTLAGTLRNQLHVELENMELFGVASVCQQKSIAWNAVLGVTNRVGSQGHREWQKNFKQVAVKTGEFLSASLKTGRFQ